MNSCLYDCRVMHHRLSPIENRFVYSVFLFCIDLDELDLLHQRLRLFSRNRPNLFAFYDRDHLQNSKETVREKVEEYLKSNGIKRKGGKILLLTNARTFGYVFNPVSFYFCFTPDGVPECVVVEVGNTFGEVKPFFLGPENIEGSLFQRQSVKHFYVSPFIDLDAVFEFRLRVPGETLDLRIDDWKAGKRFFLSSLSGTRRRLTDRALAWYSIRFPFITGKVVGAIHWQALKLSMRKLPFHRKNSNHELQKGVIRGTHHS